MNPEIPHPMAARRERGAHTGTVAALALVLLATEARPGNGAPAPGQPGLPATNAPEQAIVVNGGFEAEAPDFPGRPLGWDALDGLGVQWAEAGDAHPGKAIRINTSVSETNMVEQWNKTGLAKWVFPNPTGDPIAATYGLSYYSDPMPVATGQAYRISFRYKGPSGGAKVWVRGYGTLRGEERRLYDTIVNCRVPNQGWTRFSQAFHPTKHTPGVRTIRVMLYAYWPPGVYWFDDVAIVPISAAEHEAETAPPPP